MSIDWSKAPGGATHWDSRGNGCSIGFMKPGIRTGEWEYFGCGGHWILYGLLHRELMDAMVDRPEPQQWTGEGLPPVGTVCDWQHHQAPPAGNSEWHVGDIRYISDCTVIIGGEGCEHVHHPRNCSFRPLRTAEQIEAEERVKAIEEMVKDLPGHTARLYERMYEAGYRKQVQP